jgi:hypothetical protein
MQGDPETSGPVWVRVGIGFYSLFALPEGGDASQVQTLVSWEEEVSP